MTGAQPAARQAPASAEVTARRPLVTVVGGALIVLTGLSVPIGIAARKPFDGLVFLVVLTAVLGWLITRRQPGNRIGLRRQRHRAGRGVHVPVAGRADCLGAVEHVVPDPPADADRTVAAFAARLKDEVDLDSIRDDLAGAVHQALEPAHISVRVSRRA